VEVVLVLAGCQEAHEWNQLYSYGLTTPHCGVDLWNQQMPKSVTSHTI
jgi:hypothetical protein